MAWDITSLDYRSGLHGVVFDVTDSAAATQPLVGWDTTSQKIFLHHIKLACYSGTITLFDGSAGSMVCSIVCGSKNYVQDEWDFRKDPVQCDGTGNVCVSVTGTAYGMVKYELGS